MILSFTDNNDGTKMFDDDYYQVDATYGNSSTTYVLLH